MSYIFFFFQAKDGIRYYKVTGVQTCALPIPPTGRTTTAASTTPSRRPSPSASRSTSYTTTGRAASWTGSPACCGFGADARLEAPHQGPGRQARPGRARPRGEGRGRRAARRGDGGHLHGAAADPRDDRA